MMEQFHIFMLGFIIILSIVLAGGIVAYISDRFKWIIPFFLISLTCYLVGLWVVG